MIFRSNNKKDNINDLERKERDYYNYIANEIKDIQTQAASLKNPEDSLKISSTLLRIKDICSNIQRAYGQIAEIEDERTSVLNTDEDTEDNQYCNGMQYFQ